MLSPLPYPQIPGIFQSHPLGRQDDVVPGEAQHQRGHDWPQDEGQNPQGPGRDEEVEGERFPSLRDFQKPWVSAADSAGVVAATDGVPAGVPVPCGRPDPAGGGRAPPPRRIRQTLRVVDGFPSLVGGFLHQGLAVEHRLFRRHLLGEGVAGGIVHLHPVLEGGHTHDAAAAVGPVAQGV